MMVKSFWTSQLHMMNRLEPLFCSGRQKGTPKNLNETHLLLIFQSIKTQLCNLEWPEELLMRLVENREFLHCCNVFSYESTSKEKVFYFRFIKSCHGDLWKSMYRVHSIQNMYKVQYMYSSVTSVVEFWGLGSTLEEYFLLKNQF